jgi:hypothetical protein
MKSLVWILAFGFCAVISPAANGQTPSFKKSALSKETKQLCETFKQKRGKDRQMEFSRLVELSVFPTGAIGESDSEEGAVVVMDLSMEMTTQQLFDLIGRPDTTKNGPVYVYNLSDSRQASFAVDGENVVLYEADMIR